MIEAGKRRRRRVTERVEIFDRRRITERVEISDRGRRAPGLCCADDG